MKRLLLLSLIALTLCGCAEHETAETDLAVEPEITVEVEVEPEIIKTYYWMDGYYYPQTRTLHTIDAEGRIDEWNDVEFCLEYNNQLYADWEKVKVACEMCDQGTKTISDDTLKMFRAYVSQYCDGYGVIINAEDEVEVYGAEEE